jgi:hypothetical protein
MGRRVNEKQPVIALFTRKIAVLGFNDRYETCENDQGPSTRSKEHFILVSLF